MNHFTKYTAGETLLIDRKEAAALKKLLGEPDAEHGFELAISPDGNVSRVFLFSSQGDIDALPKDFLAEFGNAIDNSGRKYLDIGFACTADREAVGTCGGGTVRIHRNGKIEHPQVIWARI